MCGVFIFMIPGMTSYIFCIGQNAKNGYGKLGWAAFGIKIVLHIFLSDHPTFTQMIRIHVALQLDQVPEKFLFSFL